MYSPRSNPYFNAYDFAHYKKLDSTAQDSSQARKDHSSAGYELLSNSLKLPTIGGPGSNKSSYQKNSIEFTSSSSNVLVSNSGLSLTNRTSSHKQLDRLLKNAQNSSIEITALDSSTANLSHEELPTDPAINIMEDWEKQMKMLEEVDTLTAKGNAFIPNPLKAPLIQHIERFPGLKRVPIYKLMEDFQWELEALEILLELFDAISAETQLAMVEFLNSLTQFCLHKLGLEMFQKIISQPLLIHEFVVQISREEGHYLIQKARHLPPFELQVMADNILALASVTEMVKNFHYHESHRQTGQHCSLCRQKRMYNLQHRLCNDQVPKNTLTIPGLLSQYDKAEIWAADDERHYTFETSGLTPGQIFWQKMPVNLVEICDPCLLEVHKAISNKGRHDPVYHIDASERKSTLRAARDAEQDIAKIIVSVANERKLRRLREFCLSAIHLQGKGLKKEAERKEQEEAESKRQAELAQEREARRQLNEKALSVDEKWKSIDRRQDMEFLDFRNRFALVQFHRGFDEQGRSVPKERQHATTWRRLDYDEEGLPITAEAAHSTFGMGEKVDHSHERPLIDIWKQIADEKHAKFKERERLREEERRICAQQDLQTLKDYIKERITVLDRQQDLMKTIQEEEEIRRQQQRVFDKQERRRLRFEAYLMQERSHMEAEDGRSHALRAYVKEIWREDFERESMFNAECDQREVDRFWGLDYYEEMLRGEEKRLRAFYQARIIQLNREMQKMGCVQPRRKKGDRETLLVPVEVRPIGSLPEEQAFMIEAADKARQMYMIKKLKAEEIRSQVKYRLKFSYA